MTISEREVEVRLRALADHWEAPPAAGPPSYLTPTPLGRTGGAVRRHRGLLIGVGAIAAAVAAVVGFVVTRGPSGSEAPAGRTHTDQGRPVNGTLPNGRLTPASLPSGMYVDPTGSNPVGEAHGFSLSKLASPYILQPDYDQASGWIGGKWFVVNVSGPGAGLATYVPGHGWSASGIPSLPLMLASVSTGSQLLILGGTGSDGKMAPGEALNSHGKWSSIPAVPVSVQTGAAIWTGSQVYVVGQGKSALASYDPTTRTWQVLASPPTLNTIPDLVWTGSQLVEVAGTTRTDSTVAVYNPSQNRWSPVTHLGTPGSATDQAGTGPLDASYYDGRVYVLSPGTEDYAFDPVKRTWTALGATSVPASMETGNAAIWTGRYEIYYGGPEAMVYDAAHNSWTDFHITYGAQYDIDVMVWTGSQVLLWSEVSGPIKDDPSVVLAITPPRS